jgi:hypothetical protein
MINHKGDKMKFTSNYKIINCVKDNLKIQINLPTCFEDATHVFLAMDADGTICLYKDYPNHYGVHCWTNVGSYEIIGKIDLEKFDENFGKQYPFSKSECIKISIDNSEYENTIYEIKDLDGDIKLSNCDSDTNIIVGLPQID